MQIELTFHILIEVINFDTCNLHFVSAAKKSILRDRRDFWCVLEMVEKLVPEASEITTSVREMPHLK